MRGVILVELSLALDRFILHFQLKAHSLKKMFQTTSSNLILIMLYERKFLFCIMGVQLSWVYSYLYDVLVLLIFRSFGPVQDVRIPCQQKRMFGFVTFMYPETVKLILTKGNPHFVCGARVLVKPYREKSRLVDR